MAGLESHCYFFFCGQMNFWYHAAKYLLRDYIETGLWRMQISRHKKGLKAQPPAMCLFDQLSTALPHMKFNVQSASQAAKEVKFQQ